MRWTRRDYALVAVGAAVGLGLALLGAFDGRAGGAASQQATGVRYHLLDPAGLQTFSPAPASRVACWWSDVGRSEGGYSEVRPVVPTRAAGLACVQLDAAGWAEYVERWPAR